MVAYVFGVRWTGTGQGGRKHWLDAAVKRKGSLGLHDSPFASPSSCPPCPPLPPPLRMLMLSVSRAPSISVLWALLHPLLEAHCSSQQFYLSLHFPFEVTFIQGQLPTGGHTKSSGGS